MATIFRIGTRGSQLALTQANMVRDALCRAHNWAPEDVAIHPIRTTGDRVQDRALAEIGGKALWTKELDRALLDNETDCSVHSMKDVETIRPKAIRIAAMLPRADVRDRLIGAESIAHLPLNAVVGTSSPRRRAQLLRLRPDLQIVLFRGNVETRLAKLAGGEVDATLLAAAGLDRLGRGEIGHAIPSDVMLPAPSQGAVGIEIRANDPLSEATVMAINDEDAEACVMVERQLLAALGADCRSPVGAMAARAGQTVRLRAELIAEDGSAHIDGLIEGAFGDGVGAMLAADLLARAPDSVRRLFTS